MHVFELDLFQLMQFRKFCKEPIPVFEESVLMNIVKLVPLEVGLRFQPQNFIRVKMTGAVFLHHLASILQAGKLLNNSKISNNRRGSTVY